MSIIKRFLLLATLLITVCPAFAQTLSDAGSLTPELVQARIQVLRDSGAPEGGTPDGGKTTLDVYQDVMNQLREAEAHAAAEKSYTEALTVAPQQEAGIRDRMDSEPYLSSIIEPEKVPELKQADIESTLTELRVKLRDAVAAKDNLDRRIASEQSSSPTIQARLEAIDSRLEEMDNPNITIQPDLEPSDFEAAQWANLAENTTLVAERRMLEAQLASQPVRFSRRKVESDELAMVIDGLQFQVQALEAELAARSQLDDKQITIELDPDSPGYATVQRLIGENEALRAQSDALDSSLLYMEEQDDEAKQKQLSLNKQFETVQQIVNLSESSSTLGHLLMTHWHQRDEYRPRKIDLSEVGEIGNHVIQRAKYEEKLATLTNATEYARKLLAEGRLEEANVDENSLAALMELARTKRALLTDLIAVETKLINSHGSIDRTHQQLSSQFKQYERYLSSRILWVPSHPPIAKSFRTDLQQDYRAVVQHFSEVRLIHVAPAIGLGLLMLLFRMLFRGRLDQFAATQRAKLGRVNQDSIGLTFMAMVVTLLRSLAIPILLLLLAIEVGEASNEAAPYLGSSLARSTKILFLLVLLRVSCEKNGLAQLHFGWPEYRCANLHNLSTLLLVWVWPPMFFASYLFRVEVDSVNIVMGRLVFAITMILVVVILVHHAVRRRYSGKPLPRIEAIIYFLAVTTCIFLAAASLRGYIYTGYVVYEGLINTLVLVTAVAFFYSLMKRWLVLANRRWRYRQWLESSKVTDNNEANEDSWQDNDIFALSASVGQLLKAGTVVLALMGLGYVWGPLFSALEAMQRVTLWTVSDMKAGEAIITSITLASVALALFVAVLTWSAARTIPKLLSLVLHSRENVTPGSRYAAAKLTQYLIIGVGIIAVLSILGLRWDRLQWLVAALGVGIGFGLQEIIANFISGLIILFERPVRVGDVVTVGESSGEVVKIRIRATTIRDFDGKELLVPNKEFVTGRLLNWTLSDPRIRVVIEVGIAYGSDARKAAAAIEDILHNHPMVLKDPEPFVMFGQFGDSSLNLTARLFTSDVDNRIALTSDLHHRIYERLDAEGITIAFPQLDVHLNPSPAKS